MVLQNIIINFVENSYPMKKNKKQNIPKPPTPSGLANAMEYFAERITSKQQDEGITLPKKSIKLVKQMTANKRAYKVCQPVRCALCGIIYSTNWRYRLEDGFLYLCTQCKGKVKPSICSKNIIYNDVFSKR